MCKILGEGFKEYLPLVMPPVLKVACIKPEVALLDGKYYLMITSLSLHTRCPNNNAPRQTVEFISRNQNTVYKLLLSSESLSRYFFFCKF